MWILYCLLAALVLFIGVIVIRTLMFKPKPQKETKREEISVDEGAVISALQSLVKCKTVSYHDKSLEDEGEFQKLISLLPELYPNVFKTCEYEELPDRALLFRWEGKESQNPTVLMAHYDVVPVNEDGWSKPPFEGIIEDGVLWGRGTLDTKGTFNAILFAVNGLIGEGFVPKNDIYLAFSGGEEVNGMGAVNIVNYFAEKGIDPALVLDEGGAVVKNVFPGVSKECAVIGIAEKGMINLEFSCESAGGHSSAPKPHTPIGILADACCKVENNPFKMHITEPVAKMFDTLARHSSFLYRMIFANLWLFKGVLNMLGKKSGGEMNALLRTTVAFTQSSGSDAPNVIPPKATMTANLRLNPRDSVESAVARIRKLINNDNIKLTVKNSMEPSRVSTTDCAGWERLSTAVANTWQGAIVSPYLMVACSDSRHYGKISDKVYRFSAMALSSEERASIHGNDEKIPIETAAKAVEFYIRIIKES